MLDASTKIQSGMLEGNIMDFGNFDECIELEHEYSDDTGGDIIIGKYCVFGMSVTLSLGAEGPTLPLQMSLCLPDACNPSDLKPVVDNLQLTKVIGFNDLGCQTKHTGEEFNGYDIFAM